ncbi:winged helix-turn-helix transcriptional regulator [Candidatus Pelagibacter communis]|jgi:DNA-binding HxlR family transcriptional regulator|uniref:Probable transcription regulator n=2 Tax=Pelagibacter ubique TaxID=198252 RepID=Q4FMB3_PELUB|nr:helix-turn-helix domain-containing protein [Candidatus Pelagibacter ubique]AAZ21676.1 probable transcription regulator [Candidatus Pelagibacter ubique HTCC1062]EAS84471.1 probable transcription regulator [Candidatus Pelagibacter ubique HTCC1002]MBT3561624.1 helix-turn-helix transcriptional regulator [Flavobacteriaceae bacterium]
MVNKLEINKDPLNNALKLISGKWKIKILEKLINKPIRFGKLKKDLNTITAQMLSKQLKEMENDTLVKRKVIKSNPITVEYSLTQFGSSSLPIIRALIKWGSINKRKMSSVIGKDQERAIDLLNDEIRFKNLQRKNFYR